MNYLINYVMILFISLIVISIVLYTTNTNIMIKTNNTTNTIRTGDWFWTTNPAGNNQELLLAIVIHANSYMVEYSTSFLSANKISNLADFKTKYIKCSSILLEKYRDNIDTWDPIDKSFKPYYDPTYENLVNVICFDENSIKYREVKTDRVKTISLSEFKYRYILIRDDNECPVFKFDINGFNVYIKDDKWYIIPNGEEFNSEKYESYFSLSTALIVHSL